MLGSFESYNAAAYRLPPFNPDVFISSKGYQVLDAQLAISQCRSALSIIRSAALYKGWKWLAADLPQDDPRLAKSQEMADALTAACRDIRDEAGNEQDFREVISELLYAVHTGFRVTEINWVAKKDGPIKGMYGFESFAAKTCKQIGFGLDVNTMMPVSITSYTPMTGYRFDLPIEKVLRYTYNTRDSLPFGWGLGRVVYKHTWSIDFLTKFWNIALETFGSPFIVGKAPPQSMEMARKVLQQIRQGAPPVLPIGVDVELMQVAMGGLSAYDDALEYHGEQIAQAYLNSTLTSSATGSTNTNALGQVHQDTTGYSLASVRTDIENVFSLQLARRFAHYNFGYEFRDIAPRLSLGDWDAADLSKMATAFSTLIKSNVVHNSEPMVREHLKLPPADAATQAKIEDDKTKAREAKSAQAKAAKAGKKGAAAEPPIEEE